jgi:predicted molibdopterin-dependent oxidoreductase YjgC
MLLVVQDGTLVGTEPWQRHTVNEGKLCIKGWNAHQFVHHEDRLVSPLIREGDRFREASWDEALREAAQRLATIKGQHGPDAIGFISSARCSNEENYLMQKLSRAVTGTNSVDHCARL